MSTFQRPVGSVADVAELEYIACLHQTSTQVRTDASIDDADIQRFLRSRYGIDVTVEQVRHTILHGLGGSSEDDEVLDLMELVAVLLIPLLLKAAAEQASADGEDTGSKDNDDSEVMVDDEVGSKDEDSTEEKPLPPPCGLLSFVCDTIQEDVIGNKSPLPLTADLIRKILLSYGEEELAADEELIDNMLLAAKGDNVDEEGGGLFFNAGTFAQGLTADVKLFDVEHEVKMSTAYDDVFQTQQSKEDESNGNRKLDDTKKKQLLEASKPVERQYTAAAVDITAGTYRSKGLMVFLWATVLLTYFIYFRKATGGSKEACAEEDVAYSFRSPWRENGDALACESGISILVWIVAFVQLALTGSILVVVGSIGNYVDCRKWWQPLIGASCVFLFVHVPFFARGDSDASQEIVFQAAYFCGSIVIWYHIMHTFQLLVSEEWMEKHKIITKIVNPSTPRAERHIKKAAAQKLYQLTDNALALNRLTDRHSVLGTRFGQGLQAFAKHGLSYETVGGILWTIQNVKNEQLFDREGIWFSGRLVASNMAGWIISLYILVSGSSLVRKAVDNYNPDEATSQLSTFTEYVVSRNVDEARLNELKANVSGVFTSFVDRLAGLDGMISGFDSCSGVNPQSLVDSICEQNSTDPFSPLVCDGSGANTFDVLCSLAGNSSEVLTTTQQLGLLQAAGLDSGQLTLQLEEALGVSASDTVDSLYPSARYMISVPLAVGVAVAFITSLYLVTSYIPSIVSTTLKLRSGAIPTLHRRNVNYLRAAPDSVASLTGSVFWGTLAASVLVGGFIGGIVFFFLWQGSVYFAQRFVAIAIGMIACALIKICAVLRYRGKYYKSFYRVRPAWANVGLLALEWANFALSAGFIFVRSIKLLLISIFAVGRLDKPFLAEGVGLVPGRRDAELDAFPTIHIRDIMGHEAHRHPYIELLGTMYLMKLRYADHFGKTSGSVWRLIFVYALMPWMHKYRVMARTPDKADPDSGLPSLQDGETTAALDEADSGSDTEAQEETTELTSEARSNEDQISRLAQENSELVEKVAQLKKQIKLYKKARLVV